MADKLTKQNEAALNDLKQKGMPEEYDRQRQSKKWMNRAVIGAILAIIVGILILWQTVF